jgi:hypothetical protein
MELHVTIPDSYRDIFLNVWQNMFVSYDNNLVCKDTRNVQDNCVRSLCHLFQFPGSPVVAKHLPQKREFL